MSKSLNILQLNAQKSPAVQLNLLNDEDLANYGILMLSEPHAWRIDGEVIVTTVSHSFWQPFLPSTINPEGWPFRAMIWVNKNLQAIQMEIASPDICAVVLLLGTRTLLTISVYIPEKNQEALKNAVRLIHLTVQNARSQFGEQLELVIAGDFNCHDERWGGDEVALSARHGEAEPILEMMEDLELDTLLPRGTITWENAANQSTLDLMLTSYSLAESHLKYQIHQTEHESDHRAIDTELYIDLTEPTPPVRYLFKKAPWNEIRQAVEVDLRHEPIVKRTQNCIRKCFSVNSHSQTVTLC